MFSEPPLGNALTKEIDHITPHYRALIEAAPFFALATSGPEGLDCSPRGDPPGFVRVPTRRRCSFPTGAATTASTAAQPHRDPRVALLFLIPGCGETIRVIGQAAISADPDSARRVRRCNGKTPRAVLVVTVEQVYYQCTKAIVRSKLWDASRQSTARACRPPA